MKKALFVIPLIVVAVALAIWFFSPTRLPVRFAEATDPPIDFARLEQELPLTIEEREALMPEVFEKLSQEQVDQIYGRLTAGVIPDGAFDGDLLFPRGSDGETRLAEILGGRLKSRLGDISVRKTEFLGRTLWKGKVFYRQQGLLRNRIEDLTILAPVISGSIRDIEKLDVDGRDAYLLFPARVHCGQSLLDGRRESIVIDYAFTDELPGYREAPDALAGRNGLRIRDEIRMIRPGFYLGRAYMNRVFALNFTIYNDDLASEGLEDFRAGRTAEECWSGTQVVARH